MKQESKSGLADQVQEAFAINDDMNKKQESSNAAQSREQLETKKRTFKDFQRVMENEDGSDDSSGEIKTKNIA